MQYGFVLDHRKCIGCHACTVACKSENDVPVGSFRTWVKYTEIGTFPQVKRHFAVLRCNHCTSAPCITICPVNALSKRDDGIVDLDRDACIGCKACMQACPYDAIYLNEDTGAAEKCHFCAHRVEQNLQPACVVVCPEEAIVTGDLHDPNSAVSKLARLEGAVVRRPEQKTGPNVWYVGTDPVSLHPGRAQEPETYLWSERKSAPPDYPANPGFARAADARTVLDVDHPVRWGPKVAAYLVTKGIAAGAGLLAPLAAALGATGVTERFAPEVIALLFTTITTVLLIADLARPSKFFRLLTRPNTKSWLVRGGWVLGAFSGLTALILALRVLGADDAADVLRWPNAGLGLMTAIYTAFLFAQCEGRDLWQSPARLSVHLTVQAVACGAIALAVFEPTRALLLVALAATALHVVLALAERSAHHTTDNAKQAASLLSRIPALVLPKGRAFGAGLVLGIAGAALAFVLPPLAPIAAAILLLGLLEYEHAFVRAAQIPPLS